jgi:hypothetical protein
VGQRYVIKDHANVPRCGMKNTRLTFTSIQEYVFENACIKLMYVLQTTRELMMDINVDECG